MMTCILMLGQSARADAYRPSEGSGVERRKQSKSFDQGAPSCCRLVSLEVVSSKHTATSNRGRAEHGVPGFFTWKGAAI